MQQENMMDETFVQRAHRLNFGTLLIIDGYGGSYELLKNPHHVKSVLANLAEKLNLHDTYSNLMELGASNNPQGLSGIIFAKEARISLHTFPDHGFVNMDIYSTQEQFDAISVVSEFQEMLSLDNIESKLINRGEAY